MLKILDDHPHVTAKDITGAVRSRLGRVSAQAIYDVLGALAQAHLVRRIDSVDPRATRYELRTGDNHHHVVCRSCGQIADVECMVGRAPCLRPDADAGFQIDEAEIVFHGLCQQCRTAAR